MGDLEERAKWRDRKRKDIDPLEFFYENYGDLVTRKELYKLDSALYEYLRVRRLLDSIPKASRYGEDPLGYYNSHYEGISREELRKIDNGLYQKLLRERLLECVPLSKNK